MTSPVDLFITHVSELATLGQPHGRPHAGGEMNELGIVNDGAVAVAGDRIVAVGPTEQVRAEVEIGPRTKVIDASGRLATPGLVDAHTHLIFHGSREDEFVLKTVKGMSYLEIEEKGGGIPLTVNRTREASLEELTAQAEPVLGRMLTCGTTTIEAKSGYCLTLDGELKLLETMSRLNQKGPMEIIPTFFGTHEVPGEYAKARNDYFRLVVDEMIPAVGRSGLARFCDSGTAYDMKQTDELLDTARANGLRAKVHADEFAAWGGAELAARHQAVSADHCLNSTEEGLRAMAEAGVVAVLLPVVPFVHRLSEPSPCRRVIDTGVAMALGTDFNPSCLTESMQMVMAFSCYTCRLSPAEALTAATINSAHAIGQGDRIGSLEVGKQADIVIWAVKNHMQLPERVGGPLAQTVIKKGSIVFQKEA